MQDVWPGKGIIIPYPLSVSVLRSCRRKAEVSRSSLLRRCNHNREGELGVSLTCQNVRNLGKTSANLGHRGPMSLNDIMVPDLQVSHPEANNNNKLSLISFLYLPNSTMATINVVYVQSSPFHSQ